MRYWDSSALVMLFVEQPKSATYLVKAEEDPRILTAWHAVPECASAFCRLRRENMITELELNDLMAQLELQSKQWLIIIPGNRLEKLTLRALRVHSLRAMDAIHLAAAMLACGEEDSLFSFFTEDHRLKEAAAREGFNTSVSV